MTQSSHVCLLLKMDIMLRGLWRGMGRLSMQNQMRMRLSAVGIAQNVVDALEVDLMACRVHERCTEEPAEAQAEEHRCGEVDDGDTEVADARR